jgi:hypothetical protein
MYHIEFYTLHADKNNDMDSLLHAINLSGLGLIQFYVIRLELKFLSDIRNHTITYEI